MKSKSLENAHNNSRNQNLTINRTLKNIRTSVHRKRRKLLQKQNLMPHGV